jgi:hypothetical protein
MSSDSSAIVHIARASEETAVEEFCSDMVEDG